MHMDVLVLEGARRRRRGFLALLLLRRDNGLQILALSPLLSPISICGLRYLLRLVDGGFFDIGAIHHDFPATGALSESRRASRTTWCGRLALGTRGSGRMERNIEAVEECVERSQARAVVLSLWRLCAPSSQLLAGDRLRRSSGRPVAGRTPDWTMAGSVCDVVSLRCAGDGWRVKGDGSCRQRRGNGEPVGRNM
jgi:hypothetical protein